MASSQNPYQLYADEFTEEDRSELINLDCGEDASGRAATEWLHGSEVTESIKNRATRVWLYRNDAGVLVGFGSLGPSRRRWPPPDGSYSNLLFIPMLGIDIHFQGQPPAPHPRYSHQILSHLRYEAIQLFDEHQESRSSTLPFLALYVHRDNVRAIRLYEKHFDFRVVPGGARGRLAADASAFEIAKAAGSSRHQARCSMEADRELLGRHR